MKGLMELIITISLLCGGGYITKKVYITVRNAALTKASQGLPSMSAFNERLTGRKSDFR